MLDDLPGYLARTAVRLAVSGVIFLALHQSSADGHEMKTAVAPATDYTGWKSPITGRSCCSDRDCRPVAQRLNSAGQIELEIGPGIWVIPPANAELEPINESAHACINTSRQWLCWRQELVGT